MDLEGGKPPARVGFLCPNDVSYVKAQWAVWMAGGIAVPLCTTHPPNELRYFIEDADCEVKTTSQRLSRSFENENLLSGGRLPCACRQFRRYISTGCRWQYTKYLINIKYSLIF